MRNESVILNRSEACGIHLAISLENMMMHVDFKILMLAILLEISIILMHFLLTFDKIYLSDVAGFYLLRMQQIFRTRYISIETQELL